ncbi:lipoyl protein ligase domain-containing protein [Streptomyces spinoverrucosus]|uniref:lipoyl protein ligase domain-containing protein n=1 Tax=Streptomyces spinoverrucosus TaxID=284043 RepID=UPI0015818462|nr:hypothetical protein [Streptomyces spinoverrucosus]
MERIDLGEVPYAAAQTDMVRWVEERKQGLAANRLFLLTHPAVITYTARTPNDQLPDAASPITLVQTDRGGHATYHGPGQLIGSNAWRCTHANGKYRGGHRGARRKSRYCGDIDLCVAVVEGACPHISIGLSSPQCSS